MRLTIQKLIILAKAEKKQSITLAVLCVMALGLWARAAMQGPAAASAASPRADRESKKAENTDRPKPRETIVLPAVPTLARDLFVPRPEDFPRPAQTEPLHPEAEKSDTGNDDNMNQGNQLPRLSTAERVREESKRLTLRSTVVGADPIAVIETENAGKTERLVLRLGASVDGFTLRAVHNRQAVFEKDGVLVELAIPLH